jgi:hypothetical protein
MASYRDSSNFAADVCGDLLDEAIRWMSENLSPDDVFEARDLAEWAKNDLCKEGFHPDVIFEEADLADWAKNNDWMKADSDEWQEFERWKHRRDNLNEIEDDENHI